ncbi:MAG: hypothetical protein N3A38_07920 [Planctomycetota bacterium]|nr:hypothetical protein [Planctomycetota bacterium]
MSDSDRALPETVAKALEAKLLDAMRSAADVYLAAVRPDGRVEIGGNWTTFAQGCALFLAEICKDAGGGRAGSEEVRAKLNRTAEYFAGMIAEDGTVPFDTPLWKGDRYVPPWEFSGLLWLDRFHSDLLDPDVAGRLRDGLARLARGWARRLPGEKRIHNIPCFGAAALWYAGRTWGETSWQSVAGTYLARVAEACAADGCWPEHTGPTTVYNLVYVHALGINLWDGREHPAAGVLRRAGAFHSRFTYPDGTGVSIIDGRVLYHGGSVAALGLPGLLQTESGARCVEMVAASPYGIGPIANSNGVTFVPQVYRMLREGVRRSVPGAHGGVPLGDRVAVLTAGPFTAVLSGLLGSSTSHWGYDRLQHIEVHHRERGVLLGGGLSKGPDMAFLSGNGGFLAAASRLDEGGRTIGLTYPWGEATIGAETSLGKLIVNIEAHAAGGGELNMLLPIPSTWFDRPFEGEGERAISGLRGGGMVALRVEPEATLRYPVKPWFPYHPKGEAPKDIWRWGLAWRGRGRISVRLTFEG